MSVVYLSKIYTATGCGGVSVRRRRAVGRLRNDRGLTRIRLSFSPSHAYNLQHAKPMSKIGLETKSMSMRVSFLPGQRARFTGLSGRDDLNDLLCKLNDSCALGGGTTGCG